MATAQQLEAVSAWFDSRNVLVPYAQTSLVHTQVLSLLASTIALRPRTEHFTYDDGRTHLLLKLEGSVPIQFRGSTYNIPLALWVPFNYPNEAILVFLTPTSNMLIRPSSKVELSGRVHLDHVVHLDLKGTVDALRAMFEKEPPVYAKPTGPPRPPSYGSPSPVVPPRPASTSSPDSPRPPSMHGSSSGSSSRPPLPAPPSIPPASPVSPPTQNRPPLPARPDQPPQSPPSSSTQSPQPSVNRSNGYPQASTSSPPPLPQPPSQTNAAAAAAAVVGQRQPHVQPISNILDDQSDDPPVPSSSSSSTTPLQQPTAEPQRPVHPEVLALRTALLAKLQQADADHASQHAERMNSLSAMHQDLSGGYGAIQDEMARLSAVHQVVQVVRNRHLETTQAAQARVKELAEREEPNVDEFLVCPTPVHAQLLDLLSEDSALEDTIYQLGRSLHSGADERVVALDMEKTLKRIRNLAREQFFARALGNKVLLELAVASVNS